MEIDQQETYALVRLGFNPADVAEIVLKAKLFRTLKQHFYASKYTVLELSKFLDMPLHAVVDLLTGGAQQFTVQYLRTHVDRFWNPANSRSQKTEAETAQKQD
jgi:hypothetical protein